MTDTSTPADATEQMLALVGRAITAWSFVEERLCSVFIVCTSPHVAFPGGGIHHLSSQVPTAVFFSLEGFRAKLSITNAAMTNTLFGDTDSSKCLRAEWKKIKDKCERLSSKRNKLAHWTVVPAFAEEDRLYPAKLLPPYGSLAFWQETGAFPRKVGFTPSNVENLVKAFSMLRTRIEKFMQALALEDEVFEKTCSTLKYQMQHLRSADPVRAERLARVIAEAGG